MSEQRTEKATPKRRQEARERGQVARSPEVATGFQLLTLFGLLAAFGAATASKLAALMVETLSTAGTTGNFDTKAAWGLTLDLRGVLISTVAPFAIGAFIVGVFASVIQVKPGITPKVLKPKFSVISPKNGLKRLASVRTAVQFAKDILKVTIVGTVTWFVLRGSLNDIVKLIGADPGATVAVVSSLILKMGFFIAGAYLVMALGDVIYQRWQHEKDMRMTKDQVKREFKEQDVNPEVKGQMKRRQREMATRRMMAAVPEADVVITNPTHFAVALSYARDLPAPQVVAKGMDGVALRIRATAQEHGVQIVEDPPLARSLHAAVEVGQFIPAEAFAAVAEILAAVYRAGGREPATTAGATR